MFCSLHFSKDILLLKIRNKTVQPNAVDKIISVIDDLIESVYDVQKQEMIADDAR
jgi:hypothetical protein